MLNQAASLQIVMDYIRLHAVHDAATLVLALSIAYLADGIVHLLAEFLADKKSVVCRWILAICRILVLVLIWTIAAIHAMEYMSLRFIT